MERSSERPPLESNRASSDNSFNKDSESSFSATPLIHSSSPKLDDSPQKISQTFMQNQISFQRSESATKEQASVLSRKLSVKSNSSSSNVAPSAFNKLMETPLKENVPYESYESRDRGRSDSDSSLIDVTNQCSLSKSSSERSAKSSKSVRSLHVVGTYPYGSLRVHSPSPTRAPKEQEHDLLLSGDVLIMRAIPVGSLIGFDAKAFVIKKEDQFDGIKEIPAGAHFVWGGSGVASLRNGFWIMSAKRASTDHGEIHIRRWDSYNEIIVEEISLAEIRIQKEGLPEIFDSLKTYDFASAKSGASELPVGSPTKTIPASYSDIWSRLTSCIKGALLTKITGHVWNAWQVSSTHDLKTATGHTTTGGEDFSKDNVLDFVFPRAVRTFPASSIGRDRTDQAMDTSSHINAIITGNCSFEDSDEIIGELQFCFVTGMLLGNLACMEQWAHIIKTVFKAYKLAMDDPRFFIKFIDAVHAQFIYNEEGIDGSILDHDASLSDELRMILTIFKSRLNELLLSKGAQLSPAQNMVGKSFESLESFLWKWDWDLRGNYVRSGKVQLEDGESVDVELKDFEAEDERGLTKGKRRSRHGSSSVKSGVRWKFP